MPTTPSPTATPSSSSAQAPWPPPLPIDNDRYEIRLRKRRKTLDYINLSKDRKQDTRAQQRTFEGAYIRFAIGQLSFALVVVKLFSKNFVPVGMIFTVYSMLVIAVALLRRARIADIFLHTPPSDSEYYFVTSGFSVLVLSAISIGSYIALIAVMWIKLS